VNNADDQLVADYLARLVACAGVLPADRRDELVEEISAHIAEARRNPAGGAGDPAASGVAAILARLGDPEDIVSSAAEQAGIQAPQPGAGSSAPQGHEWRAGEKVPASTRRLGVMEICAVILLLGGGFLAGIGWIVGVVLLWSSDRWRTSDKVLGTLIWPGGLATTLALVFFGIAIPVGVSNCGTGSAGVCSTAGACSATSAAAACSAGQPAWVAFVVLIAVVVAGIGGPIMVAIRLIRRAQAAPVQWASDHGTLSSSY
jgi:uncharacterized membrane protein